MVDADSDRGPSAHHFVVPTEPVSTIAEAVEELTEEQKQIKESLLQLGDSISEYAIHLKSHTSAVQSLARVAELLEGNIQRQTDMMELATRQEAGLPELSEEPKKCLSKEGTIV